MIRHRATSPEAPASLPVSDDLLQEILLLLPPQPSSLPRASAVCKRWRRLATDPRFRRRFRVHHRKPPLLGVFEVRDVFKLGDMEIVFTPTLRAPDRIPPERFDLRRHGVETSGRSRAQLLGCRHGRVLLMDDVRKQIIVCDPITGDHDRVDVPPEFRDLYGPGAVLCAASDQGHVHSSSCLSSPFKVVLMQPSCSEELEVHRSIACVYSSETGIWCNTISTDAPCKIEYANTGILVDNALYWTSASHRTNLFLMDPDRFTNDIIEFDLDTQSLNVIKGPLGMNYSPLHQIVQAEDGAVGLAVLSFDKYHRFQMFQREVDCHGVSTWLLQKTIEMDNILGLHPQIARAMRRIEILGYNEDIGEIFVYADGSVYTVEHMSMQSRKLHTTRYINDYHPFTSFYTPGTTIAGGSNEAEMSHNM